VTKVLVAAWTNEDRTQCSALPPKPTRFIAAQNMILMLKMPKSVCALIKMQFPIAVLVILVAVAGIEMVNVKILM
jgi:hypothetical protein